MHSSLLCSLSSNIKLSTIPCIEVFLSLSNSLRAICLHLAPCSNGDLRLVGGNVKNEGRVEICAGNVWGTVCHNQFSNVDAKVVCRKLNYLTTG